MKKNKTIYQTGLNSTNLSLVVRDEIVEYIKIFKSQNLTEHQEVNHYITRNILWDNFPNIRSLNDHGIYKKIKAIQPQYFAIICKELGIEGGNGARLDNVTKY